MTSAAKTRPTRSVGTIIDSLFQLRESKRQLEEQVKNLTTQYTELEEQLMEKLDADGLDKATGKLATAWVSSTVVANIDGEENWKEFYAFIKKTGYFHLLQRRVSDAAYRELLESGKKIPGTQPFTKKRLNLRVVSS
jgi:predicted nuclease with TOPRIM domain